MRAFLWFFGLILLGLAAIAVLAWPAYDLLTPQFDVKFHRVSSRIGMLVLLVGFLLVARRMAVADRASLGYGLPRRQFLRETGLGIVLGVATMAPVALAMVWLDLRLLREGVTLDAATLAGLGVEGLLRGLAVALIEETFLRGAMHTGIQRESGPTVAVLLTALVYAATHFIGRYRIPVDQLGPGSGLDLLAGSLAAFGEPAAIADAFLSLAAVGLLLGMVRCMTGNIAACIGLHAGWVWVITFLRETSYPDETHPLRFLVSRFDGVVGWLVLGWTLVIGAALWSFYRRRAPAVASGLSRPRA
jgi:membrane protease YdiL (CAAX protease family)